MINIGTARWQELPLGELCDFKNGLWKGKKEPYINVGVIRNTNITKEGSLDDTDIAFLDVEVKQYSSRKLVYGDIILEKSGGGPKQAVGRVIPFEKIEGEYSFSNFTSIIRIRDKNQLNHKFLHRLLFFYYIIGATEPMQKHSTGIRNLQLNEYKQLQIPLPPLTEQKRIVAILDKAFASISQAIANTEKNLANARELFKSYLNSVFTQKGEGWKEKTINEVASVVSGYSFKSTDFSEQNVVKSIKITNVGVRVFVDDKSNMLPSSFLEQYKRFRAPEGSIVIALTRSIISDGLKVAIVPANYDGALLNQRVAGVIAIPGLVLSRYLFFYLCSSDVEEYVKKKVNTLMQPNLSINDLKNLNVQIPSLTVQGQIVEKLDAILSETQRLETIYQRKLAALDELKKSLLHQAFNGRL